MHSWFRRDKKPSRREIHPPWRVGQPKIRARPATSRRIPSVTTRDEFGGFRPDGLVSKLLESDVKMRSPSAIPSLLVFVSGLYLTGRSTH